MKIIDFIRLIRKHIVLLLITPLITAGLVIYLTKNPVYRYASETILYTGIATGSSIDVDKSFSYFANNAAFDNLINVIKARSTHQDVAVRLLSLHLLLDKADPKFISESSLEDLRRITPAHISKLIIKTNAPAAPATSAILTDESPQAGQDGIAPVVEFSFNDPGQENLASILPASVKETDYEQTVKNLTEYMLSSDTNFVYRLLNFDHPFYSIKAISSINVQRMSNSDLLRIKYESLDPGICRHTLALLSDVFIKNHKNIKENRTDAVVKYFEFQLRQASAKLQAAEDKLLEFNKANNIINYYEQSKAIAIVKEDLDVEFNNNRIKHAGIQAAIRSLEDKLGTRERIQLKSADIVSARDQLSSLNTRIRTAEMLGNQTGGDTVDLAGLKIQVEKLKEEIKNSVNALYAYNHSIDGIPTNTILNEWINNVIEAENIKAGNQVLGDRIREFQKQYEIYAPAGANIKRIEREISISEQEFLEILYGLNLAKLKQQDNELSSNIKPVDPPFFPITPIPTKRSMVVLIGGMVGFMLIFSIIFILEYFDNTLRMPSRAERILKLPNLGVFPKILLKAGNVNLPFVNNRLVEIAVQNTELSLKNKEAGKRPQTLLFFSTLSKEGKSVTIANLAAKFKAQGKKILILNFNEDSLRKSELSRPGYKDQPPAGSSAVIIRKKKRISIIRLLLGYPDNRIDYNSPFLNIREQDFEPGEYQYYQVSDMFYAVKNYEEILKMDGLVLNFTPDLVFIELPPVLYYPYPVDLISGVDQPVLVCRSNRVWTEADQGALDTVSRLNPNKTQFILNGVDLQTLESVIGELPRKRSWLRHTIKNIVLFRFFSENQF